MRYMMATTAFHEYAGNISREQPSLCIVNGEQDSDYIGQWVTGLGLFEVKFPKTSTRELTAAERRRFDGMSVVCGGVRTRAFCLT